MRIESEMNVPLLLLLLPTHNVDVVLFVVIYVVGCYLDFYVKEVPFTCTIILSVYHIIQCLSFLC